MSFNALRTEVLAALTLAGFLLTSATGSAQPEDEVLMRPVPAGVFSESIVTVAYIPLDDVAQALGARLQFDSNRNTYTAQPGETGVLRINPEHVMGIVIEENPSPEIGRDRMGVVIEDRPAPEDDSERVAQTARLNAAHQPAAARLVTGEPGTPRARPVTFEIEGNLVSRGIIIVENRPYMPLEDFAAAIGVSVDQRVGRSGLIYMFNPQPQPPDPNASPLLELSRRGRSLVEGREP